MKLSEIEESLKQYLKPLGEKELKDYREQVIKQGELLKTKRDTQLRDENGFKLQLITIAGGTISIFISLQGGSELSLLIKLGYASLGISLLCGITSLFFGLRSRQMSLNMEEENSLIQQKNKIDGLEKFYHMDASSDKWIVAEYEKIIKEINDSYQKREDTINKILKKIHLNHQKIEDGQLLLFMLGIFLLVIGLFMKI